MKLFKIVLGAIINDVICVILWLSLKLCTLGLLAQRKLLKKEETND
jgi:hypothetical protein